MANIERRLVTIRTISAISPIPNADAIEVLSIDGWKVVGKKGEFQPGSKCVYFEIDSFLPESDSRFSFLMKSGVRTFNDVRGHVLRTIKLRGQVSQGLALPLDLFPEVSEDHLEIAGVVKYEPPIPAEIAGQVKGVFPRFMKRTDQERIQNILDEVFIEHAGNTYEVSMKLDGTSTTYYCRGGEVGACIRNYELKLNEENRNNTLVKLFKESGLQEAITKLDCDIAIQGELMGPGIQGNREKLSHHVFFVFDMQFINQNEAPFFLTPAERMIIMDSLKSHGVDTDLVRHVPIINERFEIPRDASNIDDMLKLADGPSLNHAVREGIVLKAVDGKYSFKVINNVFLLKN